ncbi:PRA1 family protein B2-like [Cucurbita pepo subsp. pepo]|uniref:PRA1 family protein B2-like n=1 Tax=Cucurbita pepo subsp. pepo TaxID=3664 RepID=UPI000C9D7292|nr:PRA1 family protein B2-like [Cucurbita pepo subsp. pepo]
MPSSSPAILPVSNSESQPQIPLSSFASHIFLSLRHAFSRRRPWPELLDRSAFSKPESLSEATLRIRKNYTYFRVNYFAIIALILAFSFFSNPSSLFLLIALLSSWIFLYLFRPSDQPLVLFGRLFRDSEILIGLVVFTACVIFLTSVGSVLVSSLTAGAAVVCAHGALRSPDDLFLDEQEVNSTGFLGLFAGAPSAAAASAAPSGA